jgi:hypothetical protein
MTPGIDVLWLSTPAVVDPAPWARGQMAFTLAFHIILVPLGVSWAAMTLVANYRALKNDDRDALLLAQRWSKYMAVTFAVGAVTGTVLSFEFGLLWPRFMDRWGAAFGVPFAFEGLFFFTEAIFISIYIYGWRSAQAVDALLDGAGFAFQKVVVRTRYRRLFGATFALSSVAVPYCLGAVAGGIASGRVPGGGRTGDPGAAG